jgi:hypothetical protein
VQTPYFTPCKNVDKWTVDFKMCSAATSAIINSNLKIAARYCLAFSSPSLTSERNDQNVWDSLFDMAVSIADQFEILPTIPRRPG